MRSFNRALVQINDCLIDEKVECVEVYFWRNFEILIDQSTSWLLNVRLASLVD